MFIIAGLGNERRHQRDLLDSLPAQGEDTGKTQMKEFTQCARMLGETGVWTDTFGFATNKP